MQRIIYHQNEVGYAVANVKYADELEAKIKKLESYKAEPICIFDVQEKQILFKCKSFDLHLELLKMCYPTSFVGKVFNRMLFTQKPTKALVNLIERQSISKAG